MDVYREYKKIIEKKKSLEREIETLPRGYLRFKKIGKHNYCYLQFRDGDRVKSVYVKNDGVEHLQKTEKSCLPTPEMQQQVHFVN